VTEQNTDRRFTLAEFRRKHALLIRQHDEWLRDIDALADRMLQELLDVAQLVTKRPESQRGLGSFPSTFLWLAGKVVSHSESIRALVGIARYGDASMLIRGLIGDVTMLQYLAAYPSVCPEYFELSQIREPRPKKGSRYAKLKAKFSEANLRQQIERVGDRPVSAETYGIYSEPAHPSLWGAKFYAVQHAGALAEFSIAYSPVYQQVAAFRCVATAAAEVLDAVDCFYVWSQRTSCPWAQPSLDRWLAERDRLLDQITSAFQYLEAKHVQLYGDPRK